MLSCSLLLVAVGGAAAVARPDVASAELQPEQENGDKPLVWPPKKQTWDRKVDKLWPTAAEQCELEGEHKGCWPTLLLIGAMKSGTSSVFRALYLEGLVQGMDENCADETYDQVKGESSDVWVPSPNGHSNSGKEAHLLGCSPKAWADVMAHKEKYYGCYKPSIFEARRFIDATPDYLSAPMGAARVVEMWPERLLPKLKILIILREPLSRTLSQFNMARGAGSIKFCMDGQKELPTFKEEFECDRARMDGCFTKYFASQNLIAQKGNASHADAASVDVTYAAYHHCMDNVYEGSDRTIRYSMLMRSMYSPQVKSWHAPKQPKLKRSQLLILPFKDVVEKPTVMLNKVSQFYGLGETSFQELPEQNDKADLKGGKALPIDKIGCPTKKLMADFFRPWTKQLMSELQASFDAKETPIQEPRFEGFGESSVPCGDMEVSLSS